MSNNIRFQSPDTDSPTSKSIDVLVRKQLYHLYEEYDEYETNGDDIEMRITNLSSLSKNRQVSFRKGYKNLSKPMEDTFQLTVMTTVTAPSTPFSSSSTSPTEPSPPPAIGHTKRQPSHHEPIDSKLFRGKHLLQFAVWAHYMSYGAALFCATLGAFAIFWTHGNDLYNCKIDGQLIAFKYLFNPLADADNPCTNSVVLTHNNPNHVAKLICCFPDKQNPAPSIQGSVFIGSLYIAYSIFITLVEDTTYGFGLHYRNDNLVYHYRISPFGLLNIGLGIYGCTLPVTMLAGFCLITLGLVQCYAVWRQEAGDGGRSLLHNKSNSKGASYTNYISSIFQSMCTFRPHQFCVRVYNEDKLSSYVWVLIFLSANAIFFIYYVVLWWGIVTSIRVGLLQGTLIMTGNDSVSHMIRKAVRYGPPTYYAGKQLVYINTSHYHTLHHQFY
jgi:hypothetical protein